MSCHRWLVLLVCLAPACKKAAPPEDRSLTMSAEETAQGRALCKAYVERVCACAPTSPELTSQCEDARSQPEALEAVLAVLAGKGEAGFADEAAAKAKQTGEPLDLSKREKQEIVAAVRKVIKACVSADAALDPAVCPRPAAR
jgi:hypothetical protein